ncbi:MULTISPECIES: oxygenase MpaB family protein [Hyphomonas]|uniref:Histidine kinase n=1 Tax=Hyphomonas adhaerens TaxID=81029 RepID=A0A3B9GZZ0_9PROT|nr:MULTISPECIES: oxygenase MpaB family protein [Hyphomonas]MBB41863.1 histidine kinase [Hyphomonas sp.]HAE28015.1 histidine kinase [Hyphomonas adhaerens]|tara:strand:+ start:9822 stop:10742 length:921 start_codon:yes stop_codon:yes gene_type:complete
MSELKSYLGWKVDYLNPPGEPAFAGPDSVSWQVFKNPVALAIGGVAAVLLEFADARIRSGVWDHSVFKTDPIGRSKRTGVAAMVGVYGPQSAARRVIQGVTNMHARVQGQTPSGESYKALDVDLLDWVSATASFGFLTAYDRFVKPVSDADKKRFFEEGVPVARLYGVQNPIRSLEDFDAMMQHLLPRFEPHPINTEFLDIMCSGRAAPGVPKGLQSALVHAAVSILPPAVRERLELGREYDLHWKGEMTVKLMAKTAESLPDLSSPAAHASERLGLPRSFLWKNDAERARLLENAAARQASVAAE